MRRFPKMCTAREDLQRQLCCPVTTISPTCVVVRQTVVISPTNGMHACNSSLLLGPFVGCQRWEGKRNFTGALARKKLHEVLWPAGCRQYIHTYERKSSTLSSEQTAPNWKTPRAARWSASAPSNQQAPRASPVITNGREIDSLRFKEDEG